MRISTKDIQVGDLLRFSDGTRGEILRIHRRGSMFRWSVDVKDDMGRIGPKFVNDAGSVEKIDTLSPHCPWC